MISKSAISPQKGLGSWPNTLLRRVLFIALVGGLLIMKGSPSASGQASFLSLDQLTTHADAIFLGRVTDIETRKGKAGTFGVFPARVTSFEVLESLKDTPKKGDIYDVTEFVPLVSPLKKGEIVLWYLTAASETGFKSPVGELSGDFRSRAPNSDTRNFELSRLWVQNLNDNRGLWSNQERLWNDALFPKTVAADYLANYLKGREPHLSKYPEKLREKVDALLAYGDERCQPRPVPMELLLAASRARLSVEKAVPSARVH